MCFNGTGDSWTRSSAWVVLPVPGVPVMMMTGAGLEVDIGWRLSVCGQSASAKNTDKAQTTKAKED